MCESAATTTNANGQVDHCLKVQRWFCPAALNKIPVSAPKHRQHHHTVLQDGQFAALRNRYQLLDFFSNFDDFCNQNHQFRKFLSIFHIKLAKMVILRLKIA